MLYVQFMHTFHYVTVINMFKLTIKSNTLNIPIIYILFLIIPRPIVNHFIYIIYKTIVS